MNIELNQDRFLQILTGLIGQSKHLQNNPPRYIPEEDRAGKIVLEMLRPHTEENGGPLKVRHIAYKPGRGNIIIEYPGSGDRTVSLVGSHLDVVPADPAGWERDPFQLTIEGDKLWGRGVTDCLGHVALITDLFLQLAESKPDLNVTVIAVLIANEENSEETGIGIDELVKQGEMERCKNGPVYWLDSAEIHPTIGTGGMAPWRLTVQGKLFHSGLPDKAVNALELGMEVMHHIQDRFYHDFPQHPDEQRYHFVTGSTLKPTQWNTPEGSINQIPGKCTIAGDIRLTPFYRIEDAQEAMQRYVDELDVTALATRGPSRYVLLEENIRGTVKLEWLGDAFKGIACDLESPGYRVLCDAVKQALGEVKPFSMTGSLPIVKDLQDSGFDVQITGFGREDTYHAPNEFGQLSHFQTGMKVCSYIIDAFHRTG